MSMKNELTNRAYSLKDRLKLFHSVARTTALYGCAAWTLDKSLEAEIRTTERRMLRTILGCKRRLQNQSDGDVELEPWPAWIKRATVEAECLREELGLESWITRCRREKFRWAGRLAALDHETWAFRALQWEPALATRKQRRPWIDDITEFLKVHHFETSWQELACDTELGGSLEHAFVK